MSRLFLILVAVLAALTMATGSLAQSASPTVYTESFRKHATRVTEEAFEAKLTPQDATYRERIKDTQGTDCYELTITPQGPEGDTKITSWNVMLRDLRHTSFGNVLVAEQRLSEDVKNNLWRLNPNQFSSVPIRARRIIRVDGFYVTIQVKALHCTPLDSPYLDSMRVDFAFTNYDPRSIAEAPASHR
jgi:hypothetical protein